MRRKDKEITDRQQLDSIIERAIVCRLGLSQGGKPYIVPLCFGYDGDSIYFHSALEGRKLDILRENNNVCFEIEGDINLVDADKACNWTIRYKSVIGFGKAHIVNDPDSIHKALDVIMDHYSNKSFEYPEDKVGKTAVIRVDIEEVSGKISGY
jgi:nitroimidazol reductase NimA-like FMN-containing flavoprotein (pyridoxamine 5'-phosphate oxidase superfamily)